MAKEVMEDHLVNLAVVIEDVESEERVLASEEFHIKSPALKIHVLVAHQTLKYIYRPPFIPINSQWTKRVPSYNGLQMQDVRFVTKLNHFQLVFHYLIKTRITPRLWTL